MINLNFLSHVEFIHCLRFYCTYILMHHIYIILYRIKHVHCTHRVLYCMWWARGEHYSINNTSGFKPQITFQTPLFTMWKNTHLLRLTLTPHFINIWFVFIKLLYGAFESILIFWSNKSWYAICDASMFIKKLLFIC